jgi:hypothetical protein
MVDPMTRMKNCRVWRNPEAVVVKPLAEGFELLDTFVKESHWWRYLLQCRDCGQRYFYEFYEEVDWVDGDDPQFCTWVPVETDEEVARLKTAGQLGLRTFRPHLCNDHPKGEARKIYWVRERA